MARKRHANGLAEISLPDDANNVLVTAPPHTGHAKDICAGLVTDDLSSARILAITYSWGPDTYREWFCDGEDTAESLVVVETKGQLNGLRDRQSNDSPLTVRSESPEDLTGLGIQTTEYLTRWYDVDEPVAVCFESLTALLQHVPLKRAYRFLHIFTRRVQQADATAHFHMVADAHDDQTVETVKQLFDAVVTPGDGADEYNVRTR